MPPVSLKLPELPHSAPVEVQQGFARAQCVYDAGEVERAVDQVSVEITVALQDKNPLLLTVLQGGLVFAGMLMRRLIFPLEQGYVHVGRYGSATSGGELNWIGRGHPSLEGRTVLVVDDILDRGITLHELIKQLQADGADEIYTAALVNKALGPDAQPRPVDVNFSALTTEDVFLIGCGMDYAGYGRNLPGIYKIPSQD